MGLQRLKVHGVVEVKCMGLQGLHGVARVKSAWGCRG